MNFTKHDLKKVQPTKLESIYFIDRDELLQPLVTEIRTYYETNFGDFLANESILKSFLFKDMSLKQVLKLGKTYGIDLLNEPYLLWIPQYLMCLPLPPEWK